MDLDVIAASITVIRACFSVLRIVEILGCSYMISVQGSMIGFLPGGDL